jgi:Rrf2 family transcriptional regulator, cysteine metabolism repressor
MKITFKGDYALKIILDLSLGYGKHLAQMKDIAKRQDIPKKFLEQIVLILKGANYVKTVRGPKGGIALAKEPAKITLGEIIRLIEGPTSPIACVSTSSRVKCDFENRCVFRGVFGEIKRLTNDVVDNTTFADMVERHVAMGQKRLIDYSI